MDIWTSEIVYQLRVGESRRVIACNPWRARRCGCAPPSRRASGASGVFDAWKRMELDCEPGVRQTRNGAFGRATMLSAVPCSATIDGAPWGARRDERKGKVARDGKYGADPGMRTECQAVGDRGACEKPTTIGSPQRGGGPRRTRRWPAQAAPPPAVRAWRARRCGAVVAAAATHSPDRTALAPLLHTSQRLRPADADKRGPVVGVGVLALHLDGSLLQSICPTGSCQEILIVVRHQVLGHCVIDPP